MRHWFSQSSDRPRAGLLSHSPSLSAPQVIFNKSFTGTSGMKRGTGHRFRDFLAKNPLIYDLRRLHVGIGTLAPNPSICTFALVGDGAKAKVLGNL
jgi:hypothetical protein